MQVDVISASLTDILDDLKLGWNRCEVCHQHKYFDQGGLSREREFGPGAFCPRRKCGAERDLKARNPAHKFSRNGSFAFSAKEARWQLLFFWTHLVLLAASRLPRDLLLTPDLGRCHVENIPRISSRISVSPSDLLGGGTDLLSGRRCARDYGGGLGPRWDRCRLLRSRPDRGACCSQAQDSASQGMERFSGFSQIFSEEFIRGLAESLPRDEIFWTKAKGNV